MQILIGIDDTDNLESRGTGYHARQLGEALTQSGLADLCGVTRHQLLVDERIRYTSHNSSACLLMEARPKALAGVAALCREFLLRESAPGSDAGLCVAAWESVGEAVMAFGRRAKAQVLEAASATELARREGLILQGLTGDGGGVIGALAAVGLRCEGSDGRFLWLPGLREMSGVFSVEALRRAGGIDAVQTGAGEALPPTAVVQIGEWPRPLLRNHQSVLLVEESDDHEWRIIAKERIKELSE